MKLTVIIYSNDPETVWNAWRFANSALAYDDDVTVFLLGKGVECANLASIKYDIPEQMDVFNDNGGKMIGCGVCCENRQDTMPFIREELGCELGSMQQLYALVKESDKVVSF